MDATTVENVPTIVYLLAAALGGGLLGAIGTAYRRFRIGPIEDQQLVTQITADTLRGAKDILAEYRTEVEVVKRQLEDYRKQLLELTRTLAAANERIRRLESDLRDASGESTRLRAELSSAVNRRTEMLQEIEWLRERIARLEGGPAPPPPVPP